MSQDDKRNDGGSAGVNPGYAQAQVAKALATAAQHADPLTRERALRRSQRWQNLLGTILGGTLAHGTRAPIAQVPVWATLDVLKGGFASGELLAGGELSLRERELARGLGADDAHARAAINEWYLGPDGQAELRAMLESGRYRIEVPEEGALLTVAALIERARIDEASALIEAIAPYFQRLRFYPLPAQTAQAGGSRLQGREVGEVVASLDAIAPQQRVLAQKEAVEVWAPYHDRVVALFLQTVEDDWPCRRYPPDWAAQARALLDEYVGLRQLHGRCARPERRNRHDAQLREFLERCAHRPESLNGREVGRIRLILQRYRDKHGEPGGARCAAQRARQRNDVAGPAARDIARAIIPRLRRLPQDSGLEDVAPVLVPLSDEEAAAAGLAAGTPIPDAVRRRVERCLSATLPELIERGLIGSADEVARLLPQITSQLRAQALPDPATQRLYAAIYRAFRRRRSLLLLNLASQVRLSELPWVEGLHGLSQVAADEREVARAAMVEASATVLSAFAHAIVPNKLVTELSALAAQAGLDLPLTEELAADIFTGKFGLKYLDAAQHAAQAMDGSLYARYYDIDSAQVLALARDTRSLAALCEARAGVSLDSWSPALSGMVLEQQQILTTHNLAQLYAQLRLDTVLGPRHEAMARHCLDWVLARQRMKIDLPHARLIMIKQSAYAWRQMLFFLSHLPEAAQTDFVDTAQREFAAQRESVRIRFEPVVRGLVLAARGQRLSRSVCDATGAQPLLGWCAGRHPQLG